MRSANRKRLKGRIRYKPQSVCVARTRVSLGGEWDFPSDLARSLEDMWSHAEFEGTEFQGFRLLRDQV